MSRRERANSRRKGHPSGGLFLAALVALAALIASGCGSVGQLAQPGETELWTVRSRTPDELDVYRDLGFIVGDDRFPAVGRFVFLPGPGDSAFAILALSLPNSALRFRRESTGFVARYRVDMMVGDSTAPTAQLDEIEEVRVASFRETSRRDESVIFQGFVKLPPGRYRLRLSVHDLAAPAGLAEDGELRVPGFSGRWLTAPLVVYRARPRGDRDQPPALLISPRATVEFGGAPIPIHLESSHVSPGPLLLQISAGGKVIRTDTLAIRPTGGVLHTASAKLDPAELPPGALSLKLGLPQATAADSFTLIVALTPGWLAPTYDEAVSYLRYAGPPTAIDSLRQAEPAARARLLRAFLNRKDPAPETPENEFLEEYFRRIGDANDRFGEAGTAGWLTDRGTVYVTLGSPDEVQRHVEAWQGAERSQVWLYRQSLAAGLRLVFVDRAGTGSFRLTDESRRAFQTTVRRLDPRDREDRRLRP